MIAVIHHKHNFWDLADVVSQGYVGGFNIKVWQRAS